LTNGNFYSFHDDKSWHKWTQVVATLMVKVAMCSIAAAAAAQIDPSYSSGGVTVSLVPAWTFVSLRPKNTSISIGSSVHAGLTIVTNRHTLTQSTCLSEIQVSVEHSKHYTSACFQR